MRTLVWSASDWLAATTVRKEVFCQGQAIVIVVTVSLGGPRWRHSNSVCRTRIKGSPRPKNYHQHVWEYTFVESEIQFGNWRRQGGPVSHAFTVSKLYSRARSFGMCTILNPEALSRWVTCSL